MNSKSRYVIAFLSGSKESPLARKLYARCPGSSSKFQPLLKYKEPTSQIYKESLYFKLMAKYPFQEIWTVFFSMIRNLNQSSFYYSSNKLTTIRISLYSEDINIDNVLLCLRVINFFLPSCLHDCLK